MNTYEGKQEIFLILEMVIDHRFCDPGSPRYFRNSGFLHAFSIYHFFGRTQDLLFGLSRDHLNLANFMASMSNTIEHNLRDNVKPGYLAPAYCSDNQLKELGQQLFNK